MEQRYAHPRPLLSLAVHLLISLSIAVSCAAQIGPNSPTAAANNAALGSNAWSSTGSIFSSDNGYATVATKGITNYLVGTGFEFNLTGPANVLGIQLDIERHSANVNNVALLDNWTSGLSRTISAGTNRCLVVIYSQENGTTRQDITAMTYGGRAMTQHTEFVVGGGASFSGTIEVWTLLEAEIALAAGNAIVPTYGPSTQTEFCESFSSAVFQNVDQLVPISDTRASGAQANPNPHQLGSALTTLDGSMAVNAVMCGNNTTPASTIGGTNTYTINSGYTEGTDIYYANAAIAPTSGVSFQTSHKAITTGGTEQPSCTFAGSVNRWLMVGFTLQRARELDNEVRLLKGGVIGGSDLASTGAWPTSDALATYGGPTALWGRTWSLSDINAVDFGAATSVRVQNGTASVDHFQITVYIQVTLPIELLDLRAVQQGQVVRLDWATATEVDNDHFVVQRSWDGTTFEDVERVEGAGNSVSTLFYSSTDQRPRNGLNYYRLKQVDIDGTTDYSDVVAVDVHQKDLAVFPNPTDGSVTLLDVVLGRDQVAIYSPDMRLIRTHVGAGTNPAIHLGDLPDGTYVIMVRTGEEIRTTRVVKASISK
jgi:hypothetical protein